MEPINLKRLASELNLSISTVSKALRDSYEISPETKQRVFELAAKLHYVPNPYASSLRRKKSRTIAVVFPEVADSFFSLAIQGIETVAQAKGYHVLIYLTHESYEKEKAILQDFGSGRVDGVLISMAAQTPDTEHMQALSQAGVPLVFFDRGVEDADVAQITTDDFESGYRAARHLLDQGCRNVAFLSASPQLAIMNRRQAGYERALTEAGMTPLPGQILYGTPDPVENHARISALLQGEPRVDGVLASVEKLAIATYQVCAELAFPIPERVKVMSFSNLETAALLNPALTTITQPAFDMGQAAATVLFKALEKKHFQPAEASVMLPSVLFPRDSTRR